MNDRVLDLNLNNDNKEYLIVKSANWRVWNNGVVENLHSKTWGERNGQDSLELRTKFLKLWEDAVIGDYYNFSWSFNQGITRTTDRNAPQFLGLKLQKQIHSNIESSDCDGEITIREDLIICYKCGVVGINYEHKGR